MQAQGLAALPRLQVHTSNIFGNKIPLLGLQKASVRRGTNVTLPQFGRSGVGGRKDLPKEWSDAVKSLDGMGEHATALAVTSER